MSVLPRTTGGRGGIRTLEAVLPPTRFPVARTRPGYATLPEVAAIRRLIASAGSAERVGFEPTVAHHHTAFRERHLQPLGHLSNPSSIPTRPRATAPERRWDTAKPPGGYRAAMSAVRLAGFEPAAFGSATQRSIP